MDDEWKQFLTAMEQHLGEAARENEKRLEETSYWRTYRSAWRNSKAKARSKHFRGCGGTRISDSLRVSFCSLVIRASATNPLASQAGDFPLLLFAFPACSLAM